MSPMNTAARLRVALTVGATMLCLACPAAAATGAAEPACIEGRVVSVESGDTLTVLDARAAPRRVRLAGIEAPAWGRPGAHRSKDSLARLVLEQPVRVDCYAHDPRGRIVGKVWAVSPDMPCRGRPDCPMTLDAGLAQLTMGRAWHFPAHASLQTAQDRARYDDAEREARAKKAGLWRGGAGAGFGKTGVP
jgi:endonuclease YncB( thermonuclease family)